ncbi:hypothetical protein ABID96_002258 [Bacillus sp. OAE603]
MKRIVSIILDVLAIKSAGYTFSFVTRMLIFLYDYLRTRFDDNYQDGALYLFGASYVNEINSM